MAYATTARDAEARRREQYHEADVVVVGAGVFGCAAAHALAQQGRSVLLLERWMREPDRIVGELLQPGGVAALRRLGLAHCLEGIDAVPCHGYDVVYYGDECLIPYPPIDEYGRVAGTRIPAKGFWMPEEHQGTNGHAEHDGDDDDGRRSSSSSASSTPDAKRPEGRSFHHGRFIMQLRRACAAHPNITMVETEATAPIRGEHTDQVLGVEARTTNPATGAKEADYFFGGLTVVADGYASKFRQHAGLARQPLVRSKFYALELIDCPLPHQGYGHVILGDAYPVLLYQIGARETRALIDVPDGLPAAAPSAGGVRGYIRNVVVPALPPPVRPSVLHALDGDEPGSGSGKLRSMPNSWLPPARQRANGLILVGDALNMRHPLTGGGMTVALNDVVLLAELLHPKVTPSLADAKAVRVAMRSFHRRRKPLTGCINVLAQALYALFAATDPRLRTLREGCWAYFRRGVVDEPVAMLGGLIHDPVVLFRHFFTVAFLALWLHALEVMSGPWGVLMAPLAVVDAVLILWKACVVFLPVMWRELQ